MRSFGDFIGLGIGFALTALICAWFTLFPAIGVLWLCGALK